MAGGGDGAVIAIPWPIVVLLGIALVVAYPLGYLVGRRQSPRD